MLGEKSSVCVLRKTMISVKPKIIPLCYRVYRDVMPSSGLFKKQSNISKNTRGFIISKLRMKSLHHAGQGSLTLSSDSRGLLTASWGIGRSWEESWEELGNVGRGVLLFLVFLVKFTRQEWGVSSFWIFISLSLAKEGRHLWL